MDFHGSLNAVFAKRVERLEVSKRLLSGITEIVIFLCVLLCFLRLGTPSGAPNDPFGRTLAHGDHFLAQVGSNMTPSGAWERHWVTQGAPK